MRIWRRMSPTLPCTSAIGAENTATRLTTPSSRIGTATWPSSPACERSPPIVVRPRRAATSATLNRRSGMRFSV